MEQSPKFDRTAFNGRTRRRLRLRVDERVEETRGDLLYRTVGKRIVGLLQLRVILPQVINFLTVCYGQWLTLCNKTCKIL